MNAKPRANSGSCTPPGTDRGAGGGPAEGVGSSEVRSKVRAGGGRVLVVDDCAIVRDVLDNLLRLNGYDVIVVASGEEAVAMYRTLSGVVDLVMVDLCMPGIDGYETFRQLRTIRADACVILCSGAPESRRLERALADGAFGFLGKPFTASQALELVEAALHGTTDRRPSSSLRGDDSGPLRSEPGGCRT